MRKPKAVPKDFSASAFDKTQEMPPARGIDIPVDALGPARRENKLSPNDIYEIKYALAIRNDIVSINGVVSSTLVAYDSLQRNMKELKRDTRYNRGMLVILEGAKLTDNAVLTPDENKLVMDYQTIKEKIELIEKNRTALAEKLLAIEKEIRELRAENTETAKIKIEFLQSLQEEGQSALLMPVGAKDAYSFMGFTPGDANILEALLHENINLMTRQEPVRITGEFGITAPPLTPKELDQGLSALG